MILSIGCSHSAGPYDSNDKRIESKFNWPEAITQHTNEKHRHIAIPGQGIISYYEVLKHLEDHNLLLHINKLLVQHTQEPRIVTSITPLEIYDMIVSKSGDAVSDDDIKFKNTILDTDDSVMNIGSPNTLLRPTFNGRLTKNKPNTETKLFVTEMFDNIHSLFSYARGYKIIFDLVRAEIIRICERNNIELFEFAWDWSASHANELTRDYEKVHTISSGDFMIVKEEFMKIVASNMDIDYQSNKQYLKTIYDDHTNMIGHFVPSGESIAQKAIINYLKSVEFFNE